MQRARVWIVDGNNVFGSRPDGWWRDRAAAAERLTRQVAAWCRTHDDRVILVFDGPRLVEASRAAVPAGDRLSVDFAERGGRDAADDHIVALALARCDGEALTVVSADRGLIERLPPGVAVEGPARFLALLGSRLFPSPRG